jgi:hypothetical protein
MIDGKHKRCECVGQLKDVVDSFSKTGLVAAAAPAEVKEKVEGMDMMMEGGDEADAAVMGDAAGMMMEAMGKTTTDPRGKHEDAAEYAGFAETPACYLRNALVNEYFGDLVKQRIVAIQFLGDKAADTNKELDGAAGYLTSGLATGEKATADAWFSGLVGELD